MEKEIVVDVDLMWTFMLREGPHIRWKAIEVQHRSEGQRRTRFVFCLARKAHTMSKFLSTHAE